LLQVMQGLQIGGTSGVCAIIPRSPSHDHQSFACAQHSPEGATTIAARILVWPRRMRCLIADRIRSVDCLNTSNGGASNDGASSGGASNACASSDGANSHGASSDAASIDGANDATAAH
jgi:hypothetical protein